MAESKEILASIETKMGKAIEHFCEQLSNVRAGKASVNMLNGITVDSYGMESPLNQVASVTVPDAKTILIQPWDKSFIAKIEKAIMDANIGVTPSNNGEHIRITLPPLTEERRKQLVKQIKGDSESCKIALRNLRREAVEAFKKAQKDGMPEDMAKDGEAEVQKLTDKYSKMAESELADKEKEIMTV